MPCTFIQWLWGFFCPWDSNTRAKVGGTVGYAGVMHIRLCNRQAYVCSIRNINKHDGYGLCINSTVLFI